MRYEDFVRHVERVASARLDSQSAERVIAATLTTLGECLPSKAARDLAAQLPGRLQAPLTAAATRPEAISVEEFLRRLAERAEVSPSEALHHARAVMDALAEAVTGHELEHVRDQLPEDLRTLFAPPAAAGWPDTHRHRPHP